MSTDPGLVHPPQPDPDAPLSPVETQALRALVAASGDADRPVPDGPFPPLLRAAMYALQGKGCAVWHGDAGYRPTAKGRRIVTGQR